MTLNELIKLVPESFRDYKVEVKTAGYYEEDGQVYRSIQTIAIDQLENNEPTIILILQ